MFPSDTDFETKITLETEVVPTLESEVFRILLLGDWSGRESRSNQTEFSPSRPLVVDRDNFDDVIKKLDVRLDLEFQGNDKNILSLHFTELDDFHPDKIFQQIPLFSEMRDLRRKLSNPDSFEEAAREVRSWFSTTDDREIETVENQPLTETNQSVPDNLLDQILAQSNESPSVSQSQDVVSSELSSFIRTIVHPHLVKTDEAEQSKLLAVIDEVTSDLMRKILHHPQFQAMESAWRGLYFLVRRVETDVDLKLFLLDIGKNEISVDLKSVSDLTDSIVYKWLVKDASGTFGGEPWAVVCGNYNFGLNIDDVATLIRLGKISSVANAPFISHIKPAMLGITSLAANPDPHDWQIAADSTEIKLWETLRSLPEATYLGLAIPRFLARLPYGKATEPTETFSFEELISFDNHNQYLWTNPSFACASLLAQSFSNSGWEMGNALQTKIDGLPIHLYQQDGESKTKPCAEVVLTENACDKLLEKGLMPLLAYRNSDIVRLARFQSIAFPLRSLSGKW
ncbi:MAG: type VI secretion system contractile sheath large subunit [Thermoleophilaceae bacterium]|nr:type VI secretion system contractile sheath large subunit [Thermoleophilaceae bacterium]